MTLNSVLINKVRIYGYPTSDYNFSPSEKYPEYAFNEISPNENGIYNAVRESFRLMEYDKENFGTPQWNPLKGFIKPGDAVLLKPNLVVHENYTKENGMDCVITHPSIIRAVGDYALLAMKNKGLLIIGDAPIQSCDFDALIKEQGLQKIEMFYKNQDTNIEIELLDFRNYKSIEENGVLVPRVNSTANGVTVDLGKESEFYGLPAERIDNLRVTNYPKELMNKHHNEHKHEYVVAKKMLEANVIINMPKPKTHRYAGVTIALKNLIGINANKECLPHYSTGSKSGNGDEYKDKDLLKELYSKVIDVSNVYMRDGAVKITKLLQKFELTLLSVMGLESKNFFGSGPNNDTIWRTILDVNKIVYYADKNGKLHDTPQRKMLIIGDMIISGHESGPLAPTPKNVGVIAIGENPVSFDEAVCKYMGYDCNKISTIKNARKIKTKYNFSCSEETIIKSNDINLNNKTLQELTSNDIELFTPHPCWKEFLLSDSITEECDVFPQQKECFNIWKDEDVIRKILNNKKEKSVYLYGAGMFTELFISSLSNEQCQKIAGIIGYLEEDFKKNIYGFKVCHISDIKENSSIIISSITNQDIIYNRIKYLQSQGHSIVKLHGGVGL